MIVVLDDAAENCLNCRTCEVGCMEAAITVVD